MSYPEIPELPPAPLRSQPEEDYAATASAFVGAMNPWGRAVNAAGAWIMSVLSDIQGYFNQVTDMSQAVEQSAEDAEQHSQAAQGYAQAAGAFSDLAASNANFKGEWSALSGAATIPTTVRHNGTYWQLLRNIPNIATSQPGVSTDWATTQVGARVWEAISGNVTLVQNGRYAVAFASGQQLTLPAAPAAGDTIELYRRSGNAAGAIIRRNGKTIMGVAEDMTIDTNINGLDLIYSGADWRIRR